MLKALFNMGIDNYNNIYDIAVKSSLSHLMQHYSHTITVDQFTKTIEVSFIFEKILMEIVYTKLFCGDVFVGVLGG